MIAGVVLLGFIAQVAATPHADMLESWKRRDVWQQPDRIIAALEVSPGDVVADLGSGRGYFTHRFADAVGPTGRVIALDAEEKGLAKVIDYAVERGVLNIETRLVPSDDPTIEPNEADLIFICRTWHYFRDRFRYAGLLREALGHRGRMAVIGPGKVSVPRTDRRRTNAYEVMRESEAAGMRLVAKHDFLERDFFVVLEGGRGEIYDTIDEFHYVHAELAIGTGPMTDRSLGALSERGFLSILQLGEEEPAVAGAARRHGLTYDAVAVDDPDLLDRLAATFDDRETGIVFCFAKSLGTVIDPLLMLDEAGRLPLSETERARLYEFDSASSN